jgi:hypothetical protein
MLYAEIIYFNLAISKMKLAVNSYGQMDKVFGSKSHEHRQITSRVEGEESFGQQTVYLHDFKTESVESFAGFEATTSEENLQEAEATMNSNNLKRKMCCGRWWISEDSISQTFFFFFHVLLF